MEINEFESRKAKMEVEIMISVGKAIDEFRRDTGHTPRKIDIYLLDTLDFETDKSLNAALEVTSEFTAEDLMFKGEDK